MTTSHPSNDIAANIQLYFTPVAVEDAAKQAKLDNLEAHYKSLALSIVADVCDCADRATSLQRLRESFDLSISSVTNEAVNESPDWPPAPGA
jgi:hypothetical protein